MQGYGQKAQTSEPSLWCSGTGSPGICDATWKSCGMSEIGAKLYACVTYNEKGFPYTSYTGTVVESDDHGTNWCNPTHTNHTVPATGCVSTANSSKGDVPYPADTPTYGNAAALHGLHFFQYGKNNNWIDTNLDTALGSGNDNSYYAYAVLSQNGSLYPVRIALNVLPELSENDVEFYPNWDKGTNGTVPADTTAISVPGGPIRQHCLAQRTRRLCLHGE